MHVYSKVILKFKLNNGKIPFVVFPPLVSNDYTLLSEALPMEVQPGSSQTAHLPYGKILVKEI